MKLRCPARRLARWWAADPHGRHGLIVFGVYTAAYTVAVVLLGAPWPVLVVAALLGYCLGNWVGYGEGMSTYDRIVEDAYGPHWREDAAQGQFRREHGQKVAQWN